MSSKENKTTVFTKMLINQKVALDFKYVNKLLTENILEYLKKKFEGRCCEQGYVKPESIKIVNYSSGVVKNNLIIFEVVFESLICYLVEGMEINCIAKNITKAGIRCELDMEKTPVIIFVARDHHYTNKMFSELKEGSSIIVKIIGQRYELNDSNISAIAELVKINKISKKIQIEDSISGTEESVKTNDTEIKTENSEKKTLEADKENPLVERDELEEAVEEPVTKPEKSEEEAEEDPVSKPEKSEEEKEEPISKPEEQQLEKVNIEDKSESAINVDNVVNKESSQPSKSESIFKEKEEPDSIDEKEAIEALNKLEINSELEKNKEVTIVEDSEPPKRKRGRPKKIK